ncbi:MAG: hypothetical protein M0D54_22015 [Hyphomonadaceae bacterium JAD_PAG50586_4]|nr:MAG: hypothetical protein M0D54_22015 [Hyphomonadaceae bacterium JAD_PAG50586_4]
MADEGFEGEIVLEEPANVGAPEGLARLSTQFVRYPGCQQLILWLPQPGRPNYGVLVVTRSSRRPFHRASMAAFKFSPTLMHGRPALIASSSIMSMAGAMNCACKNLRRASRRQSPRAAADAGAIAQ